MTNSKQARGYFTLELGGQVRPCKAGTNATAVFCNLRNITLSEYGEVMSAENITSGNIKGDEIRDLLYSLLYAGARYKKQDTDFDTFDVGDWIDDADPQVIATAFEELASNNAPTEEGGEDAPKKGKGKAK